VRGHWFQEELALGNRQRWGPQRPEERFGHNPADHGKGCQNEAETAIEYNAILPGHEPSQSFGWNQSRPILVADCGDNTAQVGQECCLGDQLVLHHQSSSLHRFEVEHVSGSR
jgi:hypothetical protein